MKKKLCISFELYAVLFYYNFAQTISQTPFLQKKKKKKKVYSALSTCFEGSVKHRESLPYDCYTAGGLGELDFCWLGLSEITSSKGG